MRPEPGHSGSTPTAAAPLTPAPERGVLGPASTSSPHRELEKKEEHLQLPSTPETFEVARKLIESTVPQSLQSRNRPPEAEAPVPAKQGVLSMGNLVMMTRHRGHHTAMVP